MLPLLQKNRRPQIGPLRFCVLAPHQYVLDRCLPSENHRWNEGSGERPGAHNTRGRIEVPRWISDLDRGDCVRPVFVLGFFLLLFLASNTSLVSGAFRLRVLFLRQL